jgi:hypothetical protein
MIVKVVVMMKLHLKLVLLNAFIMHEKKGKIKENIKMDKELKKISFCLLLRKANNCGIKISAGMPEYKAGS